MSTQTILVTGATGNVGRHLVAHLAEAGVAVRALTRDPDRTTGAALLTAEPGVMAVAGDLTDPDSLRRAAAGADAVYLMWPFLQADGAQAAVAALASEVDRIVYLSAISVRDDAGPDENGFWGEVENVIEGSGAAWTFLRASGFAANALGWAGQVRSGGVIRWAYGQAARSLIHERDIAGVAALVLTDPGHAGAKYVLTGPESVTQVEQARIIGEEAGVPVRWDEAPAEEVRDLLAALTGDRDFADQAVAYWAGLVATPELVTRDVERVTGTPARTFREWVRDHVKEFQPLSRPDARHRTPAAKRRRPGRERGPRASVRNGAPR